MNSLDKYIESQLHNLTRLMKDEVAMGLLEKINERFSRMSYANSFSVSLITIIQDSLDFIKVYIIKSNKYSREQKIVIKESIGLINKELGIIRKEIWNNKSL
jgi:hypothetical protein